jgi:ATP-dependent DNA helicase RecG
MKLFSIEDIIELLQQLNEKQADELEGQHLDFKEWNFKSLKDFVDEVIEMAVCMSNGGGGTVVLGVKDKVIGLDNAIIGVPLDIDVFKLQSTVYDSTDPHLTPNFESFEYHGKRLLLMHILPVFPYATTTGGKGFKRIGKDCKPLTGSMRLESEILAGKFDFSAQIVKGKWRDLISPAAIEFLRGELKKQHLPEDVLKLSDEELLKNLECIEGSHLNNAGLLIVGSKEAMREYIPHYEWSFRRMKSDTELISTEDGYNSILTAISRLVELVNIDNPVQTIKEGLFHYEYPVFPIEALREALLNAFSHRDFTKPGPIIIKQFKDRLEISNPGLFIGGVTPKNILHHDPIARNRKLVEILQKTRLVNRSNMGVPRIFKNLLMEGKEPPEYYEDGETIKVIFPASELTAGFRNMIAYLTDKGHDPKVDYLLIIHYLMRHRRMALQDAQEICYQRPEKVMDEIMTELERIEVVKSIGKGRGRFFELTMTAHKMLVEGISYERDKTLDIEAIKVRVLSLLKERPLTNKEISLIGDLTRNQVFKLMSDLRKEEQVKSKGHGKSAKWYKT